MRRPDGFEWAGEQQTDDATDDAATVDGAEVDDARQPDPGTSPTDEIVMKGGAIDVKRTERLLRQAQHAELAETRRGARDAARSARAADAAQRREQRSEVKRFTEKARRRRRIWIVSISAAIVVLLALVGLVYSPLMSVRTIQVEGASTVDPAEVEAALEPLMGAPIATVTQQAVLDELDGFTLIRSFQVDIAPPSTIIVRIVERQPALIVDTSDGPQLVDPAGVELGAPTGSEVGVPTLVDVELGSEGFDAAVQVVLALPQDVLAQVVTITATTTDDVTLELSSGQRVVWGSAERSGDKADVLAALMVGHDASMPVTFDVSAPDHPVVR